MEGDGRLFADEYLRIARAGEGVYELHTPTGCDLVLPAMLYALTSAARAGLEHVYYVSPRRALLEQSARTLEAALAGNSGDGMRQLYSRRWNNCCIRFLGRLRRIFGDSTT